MNQPEHSSAPRPETDGRRGASRRRRRWLWCFFLPVLLGTLGAGYYYVQFEVLGHFYPIVEDVAYRSAQPTEGQLRGWAGRYGLKTVINLRGESQSSPLIAAETRLTEDLGLSLVHIRFSALELPSGVSVRRLIRALETERVPLLIHCRQGVDRTGVASCLAAMALGGATFDDARAQASWKYWRVVDGADDVEDFLDQYESHCADRGLPTAGWEQFKRWASEEYHPYYYRVAIDVPEVIKALPRRRRKVQVTVTNRSRMTIPAAENGREFFLATFLDGSETQYPERSVGPWTRLSSNIAPGETIEVTHVIKAPRLVDTYTLKFDVVENHVAWFAHRGSPVSTCRLIVSGAVGRHPDRAVEREKPSK